MSQRVGLVFVTCHLSIAVSLLLSASLSAADVPTRQPNIVFILVDDLGWSDLGCYGNRFHETPHVDQLANEGVRFTDFYAAAPVCSPTRASIFSGQYPARLGLTDFLMGHWRPFERLIDPEINDHLPLEIESLGEVLKGAGYATSYFGKWHLGGAPNQHPSQHGFDRAIVTRGRHFAPLIRTSPKTPIEDGTPLAEFLTDQTVQFIDAHRDQPFCVVLSHFAVHIPLEARLEKIAKYSAKGHAEGGIAGGTERPNHPVYAAMVEAVDRSLGRVVQALDETGVADNTLVVFTSDNGGLRQIFTGTGELVTTNAPLRDEKGSLYEGGIRVPLVVRWPGVTGLRRVCPTPTATIDLLPTFAEAAGAETPSPCDGVSLVPLLENPEGTLSREALFFHYPHYHHSRPAGAIRAGDWKLIEFFGDETGGAALELYNLRDDLGESRNLAQTEPQKTHQLHDRLKTWRESVAARMPRPNPDFNTDRADEWWNQERNKPIDREAIGRHYRSPVADRHRAHPKRPDAAERPNVVLIISDDQGWTDYGFMGHPKIRTPRLDRLARESLVFPRGYVPSSLCCPSLATMVTGLYPHQHLIMGNDPTIPPGVKGLGAALRDPEFLALCDKMDANIERVPTLPRILTEHGYLSLQTGKWWLGSYARGGFTHGMTHGDPKRGGRHGDAGLDIGRKGMKPVRDFLDIAQREGKPFFIWYAPFLPHRPHNPPDRLRDKYRDKVDSKHVAKYWAMCEWFDETCGQLLDLLAEKDVTEDTIVLYVCDNGWIQLAGASGFAPKSKRSPNEGGVRTPIMIRWPGRVEPARSDHLASSIDLAPTVLRACGLEPTDAMPGINLLDAEAIASRKQIFGEIYDHDEADLEKPAANLQYRWCIDGRWKLIVPYLPNVADAQIELFDLSKDPHEERNLANEKRDIVERLRRILDAHWTPADE